ncbi:Serine protease 27 [Anopheles sinensis]|uniref:Serine protease 27 n=1 Tax=Anopheles sinensis TaxID=74873 RepID=A0A084W425_ANOSI|nr:Serine protease 27 [Anopheles sinensis]
MVPHSNASKANKCRELMEYMKKFVDSPARALLLLPAAHSCRSLIVSHFSSTVNHKHTSLGTPCSGRREGKKDATNGAAHGFRCKIPSKTGRPSNIRPETVALAGYDLGIEFHTVDRVGEPSQNHLNAAQFASSPRGDLLWPL